MPRVGRRACGAKPGRWADAGLGGTGVTGVEAFAARWLAVLNTPPEKHEVLAADVPVELEGNPASAGGPDSLARAEDGRGRPFSDRAVDGGTGRAPVALCGLDGALELTAEVESGDAMP